MIILKRAIAFISSVVSLLTGYFGISGTGVHKKLDDFRVTSYVVADYIQNIEALHSEDFDIITDAIIFGAVTFDSEGNINVQKEKFEKALTNLRSVIGERDVSITVNILGPGGHTDSTVWEDQMEAMATEHIKAFRSGVLEKNIVALLDEYKLDGVHFDYEYPISLKAWFHFNNFLVSLGRKLGDYTLGVACVEWNLKFSTLAIKAVDTFELMVYDNYHSEGRHSTYETVTESMYKVGLAGIPAEKVDLGLPFYARPTDRGAYWYPYSGYYNEMTEDGWYTDENIGKTFWFNTPEVIEQKTRYAVNEGYGGVMIWHYTCDFASSHEASLLGTIGRVVK